MERNALCILLRQVGSGRVGSGQVRSGLPLQRLGSAGDAQVDLPDPQQLVGDEQAAAAGLRELHRQAHVPGRPCQRKPARKQLHQRRRLG